VATKTASRWYSHRIEQEIGLVRWGHWGQPVLLFPTAGGDAEEAERMHLIDALMPLIDGGRVKIYSLDSLAGRALAAKWGSIEHRCWLLNQFEETVAYEIVPAIRTDCNSASIELLAAGSSIGAFKAVSVTCRYPWLFRGAIGMSGTYDLERLFEFEGNQDFYFSAALSFVPNLDDGPLLDELRRRFFVLAYGQGRWESPEESWRMPISTSW
jgi:esterase/lipase superfamily enzyme